MLRSMQYLAIDRRLERIADIAASPLSGSGQVAVDPCRERHSYLAGQDHTLRTARRPVGGQWSTDATRRLDFRAAHELPATTSATSFCCGAGTSVHAALQAARWSATLAPAVIAHVISSSGALTIDFTPPASARVRSYAVLNYEYSLDNGATWTARAPASALSPIVVDGLIDGIAYPIRLRAVNVAGPGLPSDTIHPDAWARRTHESESCGGWQLRHVRLDAAVKRCPCHRLHAGGRAESRRGAGQAAKPGTGTIFTLAAPSESFMCGCGRLSARLRVNRRLKYKSTLVWRASLATDKPARAR